MTVTEGQGKDLGGLFSSLASDWLASGPESVAALLAAEDRETLERLVFLVVGTRAERL